MNGDRDPQEAAIQFLLKCGYRYNYIDGDTVVMTLPVLDEVVSIRVKQDGTYWL